jgi:hypothetical protein
MKIKTAATEADKVASLNILQILFAAIRAKHSN